jgi:hypothetical protein
MLFVIEKLSRRVIAALVVVSIVFLAFGSGLPTSHAMGNVPSCGGAARADTGGEATSSTGIKLSQADTNVFAGQLIVSGPGKQITGTASAGADCCGSYCAPAFSLADHHSGVILSSRTEAWTVACDLLRPTEPSSSKRPPRAASPHLLRA